MTVEKRKHDDKATTPINNSSRAQSNGIPVFEPGRILRRQRRLRRCHQERLHGVSHIGLRQRNTKHTDVASISSKQQQSIPPMKRHGRFEKTKTSLDQPRSSTNSLIKKVDEYLVRAGSTYISIAPSTFASTEGSDETYTMQSFTGRGCPSPTALGPLRRCSAQRPCCMTQRNTRHSK